jgi:nucleotide-binding universal stress UspA family protein
MARKQSTSSAKPESAPFAGAGAAAKVREIVVFIDGRTDAAGILEFASTIAEEQGAHLISVFLRPAPTSTTAQTFARGEGIKEVIDSQQEQLEGVEARYKALFADTVRRHGLQSEWRSLPYLSSEVAVHAYYADLVVVARPEPVDRTASPPGLAESLILSSGRPIIVFPPRATVSRVRRALVGWNAKRESIRAVADALPILAKAEAVEVLVADHQRDPKSHGQEPGADIARHLARHGAHVEVRRLPVGGKDVGHLLLSEAVASRADLLVMGAYGHSQFREWVFGSVTQTVLYEAALPVLMSR